MSTDSVLVTPETAEVPLAVEAALALALDSPIGSARLRERVTPGQRVLIIVSDATRDDPRHCLLSAVLDELPDGVTVAVAVANGTHGPCDISALGLGAAARGLTIVNHDAFDVGAVRQVGTTSRGTPVRVNRCVLDADLVVATGVIKPHYFAGFGAGIKAVFPGLGENAAIRVNHELKNEPGSRPGVIDGNPCREDLEDCLRFLPPVFLLNLVRDSTGAVAACVAGDPVDAFRHGARQCDALYRQVAPASRAVVVSDKLPVTASLYQASKLVAAAAPLLVDRGTMIIAAECPEGTGPVDVVNHGIYEIGLRPRLPAKHRIVLVSSLSEYSVASTYCQWAPSVESVLAQIDAGPTVISTAASMILEPGNA